MHPGCYDAPVTALPTYRQRLQTLLDLGFESVGLAVSWDEHPRDVSADDRNAMGQLLADRDARLRLHPDLGKLHARAQQERTDLLAYARRELEPVFDLALELGAVSICCDSIRALVDETVEVLGLMIEMTAGTQLQIGVENSQRGVINSPAVMNQVVDRVDDPRMGLLVDVGHINTTVTNGWNDCASAGDFLAGLRVPIWDTHIHNNDGHTDGHLTVRDPSGTLDMVAVVVGLHGLGYDGPLNMECAPKGRSIEPDKLGRTLVDDRDYLEGLIAAAVGR